MSLCFHLCFFKSQNILWWEGPSHFCHNCYLLMIKKQWPFLSVVSLAHLATKATDKSSAVFWRKRKKRGGKKGEKERERETERERGREREDGEGERRKKSQSKSLPPARQTKNRWKKVFETRSSSLFFTNFCCFLGSIKMLFENVDGENLVTETSEQIKLPKSRRLWVKSVFVAAKVAFQKLWSRESNPCHSPSLYSIWSRISW